MGAGNGAMADSMVGFDAVDATSWDDSRMRTPAVSANENRLLAGLRRGDEDAFEQLVTLFERPVYNLVYRLVPDPTDAPDVVQETFLKVFRSVGAFRGQSSLKTWIYRIAVNEAHNQRRLFGRKRGQEVGLEEEIGDGMSFQQVLEDPGQSPFESVRSREMMNVVEEALGSLKPDFRAAVVLRDIEELRYEEIAEILNLNLGTVKSRILRGREALRQELEARLRGRQVPNWSLQTAGDTGD